MIAGPTKAVEHTHSGPAKLGLKSGEATQLFQLASGMRRSRLSDFSQEALGCSFNACS